MTDIAPSPAEIGEWQPRPVNDRHLTEYFDEAKTFQQERARGAVRSSRIAWAIAGAAMVGNLALGISVAAMLPLQRLTPLYLWVQKDGTVDSAVSMSDLPRTESAAVERTAVWQYVRNRESYDFADARYRYDLVSLMSSQSARDQYQKWFLAKGEDSGSPQLKYGKRGQIDVELISMSFVRPYTALVRFRQSAYLYGEAPKTTTWTATVGFEVVERLPASARVTNPGGVIITSYQSSQDSPE
jgi:type IV secretion system protein VirB8